MKCVYTCNEPLEHREHQPARRGLGVSVHGPYPHAGIGGEAYDVEYERVEIGAVSFGKPARPDKVRSHIVTVLDVILADLAVKLAELTAHQERLQAERERVAAGGDIGIVEPVVLQPGLFKNGGNNVY